MDLSPPFICIDAFGGPNGPGALPARLAREIMGQDVVSSVALRNNEVQGLESLITGVRSSSRAVLMVSAGIPRILPFLDAFERAGITNDLTQRDRYTVHRWPTFVKSEFTGRQVEVCMLSSCVPIFLERFTDAQGRIFAKTLVKKSSGHGAVMKQEDLISSGQNGLPVVDFLQERSFVPVDDNDPLIISQPFEIAEDEKGKIEYRSWIINHRLSCVSRYWKENIPIDVSDSEVAHFIDGFIFAHRDILPKHYVLDFARTRSGGLCVVEINFLPESGIAGDDIIREAVFRHVFNSLR